MQRHFLRIPKCVMQNRSYVRFFSSGGQPSVEQDLLKKMDYNQFDDVRKYLNQSVEDTESKADFFKTVLVKTVKRNKFHLTLELFELTKDKVAIEDHVYAYLIENLLSRDRIVEAFSLYFQAYLNNVVLDLLVTNQLLSAAERNMLGLSYFRILYQLTRQHFIPTRRQYQRFFKAANKFRNEPFVEQLIKDMSEHRLELEESEPQKRRKKRQGYKSTAYAHIDASRLNQILEENGVRGDHRNDTKVIILDAQNLRRDYVSGESEYEYDSAEDYEGEDSAYSDEETGSQSDSDRKKNEDDD
eukprot:TRINITY_DN591_c0_g2_i1.p1 TRINITY_DN591_c0_g2~~TRINITY_DN591_c0_g2_i1.p1  ORF type:complete len:300 (+),score=36.95 TRINITY_DN591_c0_g2_i1:127-1026(+)